MAWDELAYLWIEVELDDISLIGLDLFGKEFERAIIVADLYDLN